MISTSLFITIVATAAVGPSAAEPKRSPQSTAVRTTDGRADPWFHRCRVGMEVGPTCIPLARDDSDDARYCASSTAARSCGIASPRTANTW